MDSGFGFALRNFLENYAWASDGSVIMWITTIVLGVSIVATIRKNNALQHESRKLLVVCGVWGLLYGLLLTFGAVSPGNAA